VILMKIGLSLVLTGIVALFADPLGSSVRADESKDDVKKMVERGLDWLASTQNKADGNFEANGGQYPTTMTSIAGMAFLMEGSTLREGKYKETLRKAVDWFMKRSQANGLLGNPNNPTESSRYMYGHGFGLLFLACVYGEEEDDKRRKDLERILTKAVKFCGDAQTSHGGWGYVSAAEGNNFDEGSVTITQLQGLRAARNAGIVVPKAYIDKAVEYLKKCTTPRGGVVYSYGSGVAIGGERPPLTAAAVACGFSAGQYGSDECKKWIKYCKENIPFGKGRVAHDEYQSYYFAQAVYVLGDEGYAKLFPGTKKEDQLLWSKYRDAMFDHIKTTQARDGSWTGGYIGNVFATGVNLTILQLENGALPIYQR